MEQMNILKKIIKIILIILLLLSTTFLTQYISVFLQNYKSEHSGVPDLVNSFSTNSDYTLTVIANSNTIENKEDFARQIITMCRENSFKTLQFSTDLGGYRCSVFMHSLFSKSRIARLTVCCDNLISSVIVGIAANIPHSHLLVHKDSNRLRLLYEVNSFCKSYQIYPL